ncbi:MAG: ABC transporter ATP-binding protein [Magnetovibrionaceae bacterium]
MVDPALLNPKEHASTVELMKRLWRESISNYTGRIVLALICMGIMAVTTSINAYLMEPIVNDIFFARNEAALWWVAFAVIASFLAKGAANYGQAVLMNHVGMRIIADNQQRLFSHLARLDLGFFHGVPTGVLISRFTNDIQAMKAAVSNALTGAGKDATQLIGLVGLMFFQSWELALISFFVFPVAIYPIVRIGKRMRKVTANTQVETGQLVTILDQTFQGMRVVKAYDMVAYEEKRVHTVVDRIFALVMKATRVRAMSSPIMETLGGLAVATVIIYGGYTVIHGGMDAGSFFSFIAALLMAYEPLKRLANLNANVQEGLAGAQRMFAVMDIDSQIQESPAAKDLTDCKGQIALSAVDFAYDGADGPTLSGVDLTVDAGKTVALVGPSGAGKSTILNLIPRFYDVAAGTVTIDGQDVRDLSFASLYGNVALVSQEITLFDDTIRANIAYGKAGATQDEIEEAARHAAAHDFITELPEGYDTVVGEHGVKLSGGQRQRLSIARAMLKNAPILLLDEATSSLDTESERKVQAALESLMADRSTLVIAHRLSTIRHADVIYVMDQGRIVEQGNHDDLLARGGLYAHLHSMQFKDKKPDDAEADEA